jgi:hypothetical protein
VSSIEEPGWRKSRRCSTGTCVEVRREAESYLVRDSKDPAGPVLRFTGEEWDAFVAGVNAGDFRFD